MCWYIYKGSPTKNEPLMTTYNSFNIATWRFILVHSLKYSLLIPFAMVLKR